MQQEFKLWDKPRREEVRVTARSTNDPEEWEARCPRCPDEGYHLKINIAKEVYHCLRSHCNWSGHLAKDSPRPTVKASPPKKLNPKVYEGMGVKAREYHEEIGGESGREFRDFLTERRLISQDTIDRYCLGYTDKHPEYGNIGKRLTIPVQRDNKVVNIRFHSFGSGQKIKMLPYTKDLPDALALFPGDRVEGDEVWLVEGEPDCLCALSHGLPAVTVTGGAGGWKPAFDEYFRDKTLYIVYDCDEPGRKGALTIAKRLLSVASTVKILDLGLKEGQDLTDYLVIHELKQLRYLADVAMPEEKLSKKGFKPRPYALKVQAEYPLKFQANKRFWIYDKESGLWNDKAKVTLNSILRQLILGPDDFKIYAVSEILADLEGLCLKKDEEIEQPRPSLIPFKNVIYDLDTGEKLEYSPDYFFTNKLAVDLDERYKECPMIDKIFKEFVREDDLTSLYEILAYCFYRSYPYPKAFILYGGGSNGKTAYINMLIKVLGSDNVSLVGLSDIAENRFASSEFEGKMANFSSEMERATITKTTKFKRLTGDDPIRGERKFQSEFKFWNHAKMIFATNEVPLTADETVAFFRRVFLIEFPFEFEDGSEGTIHRIQETVPGYEYQGLAYKCLEKLKRLKERRFVFMNHEKTREVAKRYADLSNPLKTFLEKFTRGVEGQFIPKKDFRPKFLEYLAEKRLNKWSDKMVKRQMELLGYGDDNRADVGRVWQDIEWLGKEGKENW